MSLMTNIWSSLRNFSLIFKFYFKNPEFLFLFEWSQALLSGQSNIYEIRQRGRQAKQYLPRFHWIFHNPNFLECESDWLYAKKNSVFLPQ